MRQLLLLDLLLEFLLEVLLELDMDLLLLLRPPVLARLFFVVKRADTFRCLPC